MTLRKFRQWCNDRACDGYWNLDEATFCGDLLSNMSKLPFWKKRRAWNRLKYGVIHGIINPVNQRIRKRKGVDYD